MAKALFAVTNIKHNSDEFAVGTLLDPKAFTKDQLKDLYDAGAVEVREVEEPKAEEIGPDTEVKDEA